MHKVGGVHKVRFGAQGAVGARGAVSAQGAVGAVVFCLAHLLAQPAVRAGKTTTGIGARRAGERAGGGGLSPARTSIGGCGRARRSGWRRPVTRSCATICARTARPTRPRRGSRISRIRERSRRAHDREGDVDRLVSGIDDRPRRRARSTCASRASRACRAEYQRLRAEGTSRLYR